MTTHGKQRQSNERDSTDTHAAVSAIGSTEGSVTLAAGSRYQQIGSRVLAPQGDIDIHAQKLDIIQAQESGKSVEESKFRQTGVTVALSAPVISAIQAGTQMARAASQTSDFRMQALAGATAAISAVNATNKHQGKNSCRRNTGTATPGQRLRAEPNTVPPKGHRKRQARRSCKCRLSCRLSDGFLSLSEIGL